MNLLINIVAAALVSVAMIGSYLWGYRDGVRYCVKQMGPLEKVAREVADMTRKK